MKIHVNIPYFTRWGQRILVSGNVKELGDGDFSKALPLSLNSHENWYGEFECNPPATEPLKYKYLLFDENTGKYTEEWGDNRTVELQKNTDDYYCFDSWNVAGSVENVFMTSPFRKVLLKPGIAALAKAKQPAKYTHKFIVKAPLLKPNQALCIIGNCKQLRNWTVSDPAMMNLRDDEWELKIDLSKATTEIHYKYGVYDAEAGHFLFFEQGPDRIAAVIQNSVVQTNDGFIRVDNQSWHGAGLGLPVFSIRTRKSFGVGDFADLKLLVDWSEKIGMKLIQLLPLNDTTGTHTELDVLPYAAISAFALNPLFLNLPAMGKLPATHELQKEYKQKQKDLNAQVLVPFLEVVNYKLSYAKELYLAKKDKFLKDKAYLEFFGKNEYWLVPYAAYCVLRDKFGTSDYRQWDGFSKYNAEKIREFSSPDQPHFDDIATNYFIQYHLHLQLLDAAE